MGRSAKGRMSVAIVLFIALFIIIGAVISRVSAKPSEDAASALRSGKFYLDGDKTKSYIEVYDSGTLQCFYMNYVDLLASLKNDPDNVDTSLLAPPAELKGIMNYEIKTGDDGRSYVVFSPADGKGEPYSFEYCDRENIITDQGRFSYIG